MKKTIHPAVGVLIVVAIVGTLVGIWFVQPFQPKVYGLVPPTPEQKHESANQMKQDMIDSMKDKKQGRPTTDQ